MTTILSPSTARPPESTFGAGAASLRDILNSIFYYRRTALVVASIVTLIGVLVALILPPSYTARARLLTLSSSVYDQQQVVSARSGLGATIAVDVEMQLLSSSELHRSIVRREVGPHATAEQIDKAVEEYEAHLHLSKLETGNVIEATYRDRSPQCAATALRELLSAYFEERANVLTSGRVVFLTEQRDKAKAQLDAANAQIEAYERQNGVVDVQQQINSAVALDGLLRQRNAESEAELADSRHSVDVLKENAQAVPRTIELYSDNAEAAHTVGVMEAQLFELQAKRADLASRYMSTSPFVKQADAQIASLEADIAKQKTDATVARRTGYNTYKDTANDRLGQAEAALAGASARRSILTSQMEESRSRLKDLITISAEISRLTAQRDQLADVVKDDTSQLEQSRIEANQTSAAASTNVRVIEAPEVPRKRGNPPALLIAAALAAAVIIAGVTILIMASMRDTFLSPQEAERALKLPVLCDLARRDGANMAARRDFGRLVAAMDSVPTGGLGKTLLLLTTQAEGKVNVVAQGLAAALEPRAPGRIALVRMEEEGDVPREGAPLALRPLGGDSMSVGMNMTRTRLTNLFHDFRSTYDYVVITAPPASHWFESLELATVADLTVLVIQAEETRKPVAETVISQAGYIGGVVSALVMTGRRFYIPTWLYRLLLNRSTATA